MSEEIENTEDGMIAEPSNDAISEKYDKIINSEETRYRLTGMFKDWYLDYASYVILERAVPHINDGLKPVQRRILHTMKEMESGSYNKVANIIGRTMQYHPHGDSSIGDALVQLGQKDLLIDCQGNWGNILTGDRAAAPRYIEARLSKFALDVVFNPKITEWMSSYDGRNLEPVHLPVKFPLLLAQGTYGIAVGLASNILPHNFCELIDASIAYLEKRDFELFPDFPTGGLIDCSRYNRGIRGGKLRIRARINKLDKKTLVITEIPYGKTTEDIIDSILSANDKGKIKIKKIDDNTAANAEIVVHLQNDISPDKTIDALYAFTDCEISVSPNSCVIMDNMPQFIGVDEILKYNTDRTVSLIKQETEIKIAEAEKEWHYSSLEKIFFEKRIYRFLEKDTGTWEEQIGLVTEQMNRYRSLFRQDITEADILKLVERPVRKISKFDIKAINDHLMKVEAEIDNLNYRLEHLVEYAIDYFKGLLEKYGAMFPRKSEITDFENIVSAKVAAVNAKLYVNREEGFIGMDLKKDEKAEYVCDCSDIDDIIVFLSNGKYSVTKISAKSFVGKGIIHAAVFRKNDTRTIYNAVYSDGKNGTAYVKRFAVTGITRDKEYDLTQGKEGSKVLWFTANSNAEAETLKIYLKPRPKLKKLIFEFDFSTLSIKGRTSMGNILSKNPIHRIVLKSKGESTIGGKKIWFDPDIDRLNEDGRGMLLGEFNTGDHILAICKNGTFYTTTTDLSNRFQGDLMKVEKLDENSIYSAIYIDGESGNYYLKRFSFEKNDDIPQPFISETEGSSLVGLSKDKYPRVEITFGGKHAKRGSEIISAADFIAVKGLKAKGKRLTSYEVSEIRFIDPLPDTAEETGQEALQDASSANGTEDDIRQNPNETAYSDAVKILESEETGVGDDNAGIHESSNEKIIEPTLF